MRIGTLIISWIGFFILLGDYLKEVISKPTNTNIQLVVLLILIWAAIFLVKETIKLIINKNK